jgi:serine O-acetyltransferase
MVNVAGVIHMICGDLMERLAILAALGSVQARVRGCTMAANNGEELNVSAHEPDWSREDVRRFWDPGQKLLRSIRRYQAAEARGGFLRVIAKKRWALEHLFWSTVTQCEIHLTTQIGGGLRLTHPTGIVIHPDAVIGVNCMIFHQVTLAGAVRLGGHVDIGAGAKILGPLVIGDDARVGANAVVTRDVAAGTTVAGIPARVV